MNEIKTAVVIAVVGNKVRVRFAADAAASAASYGMLASCAPSVGDTALMLRTSTSYLCIGTVKR